jgi:nitroreductase
MNDILECIKSRRSCKSFLSAMPSEEEIDTVIDAGLRAASGRNMQAPIIVCIKNKEIRDRLSKTNGDIFGAKNDPFYGAPVILVVLARKRAHTYVYDGSLTMGNMMLAASSLGLGSCWIHRARETFEMPEWRDWLTSIGIEEEVEGIGNLALGFPDAVPTPREVSNGRVFYVD